MKEEEKKVNSVFEGIDFGELVDVDSNLNTQIAEESEGKEKIPSLEEFFEEKIKSEDPPASIKKEELEDDDKQIEVKVKEKETSSSTFNALLIAKAYYEAGGLSDFDEDEFKSLIEEKGGTPEAETEALMAFIQKEVDANATAKSEEWKKSLTPDKRSEVEALEMGIDPQELQGAESDINVLSNLDTFKLDDEGAERILRYHLKLTTSFSDEKIDKQIKKAKDLDELVDEAKEAIPEIIDIRKNDIVELKKKAQTFKEEAVKREELRVNKIKEVVSSTTEILGKKINKQTQSKLEDMLLKPTKEVNGKAVNAVWAKRHDIGEEKFDTILAGLILNGVFDGKVDLGTKPKTKAFEELTKAIQTGQRANSTSMSFYDKKSQDSVEELKDLFG